jgi:hypothetical protein
MSTNSKFKAALIVTATVSVTAAVVAVVATACAPDAEVRDDVDPATVVAGATGASGIGGIADAGDAGHRCRSYDPERSAFYGDLHVHTSYSSDAWGFGNRTDPSAAFTYARGGTIRLATDDGGFQSAALPRALDFSAVTDHSEGLGSNGLKLSESTAWNNEQSAAAAAYDQSPACTFTSFIGYEYTLGRLPDGGNAWQHRNVIFANDHVPALPISSIDQTTPEGLRRALEKECLDAGTGCDVIAITHNANWSKGYQYDIPNGSMTPDEAALRQRIERLAEVYQGKGNSECRAFDTDPYCDLFGTSCKLPDGGLDEQCLKGSFVRGALRRGLEVEQQIGVNPLKMGMVGSTDTHYGTPGNTDAYDWKGARGDLQDDPQDRITQNFEEPGGLVGAWAEENSRESLFAALKRRETFATSGTRIPVRFFGGWNYPDDTCTQSDIPRIGYAGGVPMGGDLPAQPHGVPAPKFIVWAARDVGTKTHPGTKLQLAQVVKGWVDPKTGMSQEKVYDVAGSTTQIGDVDASTCVESGTGFDSLCTVWTDPDFVAGQRAFYYARVIENPSCEFRAYDCNRLPLDQRPPECDAHSHWLKTDQKRAWTSPVWNER